MWKSWRGCCRCNTVDGSEIPNNHLGCTNLCKYWDKLPINCCRISSINSIEIQWFDNIGTSQQMARSLGCSRCWHDGGVILWTSPCTGCCIIAKHAVLRQTPDEMCQTLRELMAPAVQFTHVGVLLFFFFHLHQSRVMIHKICVCAYVAHPNSPWKVFLIRNGSTHPYIPGTLNNQFSMDLWLNNYFRVKSFNHPIETTFQKWLFGVPGKWFVSTPGPVNWNVHHPQVWSMWPWQKWGPIHRFSV